MELFIVVMRPVRDNTSHQEQAYTGPLHGWQPKWMPNGLPNPFHKEWPMPRHKALTMRDEMRAIRPGFDVWAIQLEN